MYIVKRRSQLTAMRMEATRMKARVRVRGDILMTES